MPMKVTSISPVDRRCAQAERRDGLAAEAELIACTNDMQGSLETLAKAYPGVIALGAIVAGQACGLMVCAPSAEGPRCSAVALVRMRTLAHIVAGLPEELRDAFLSEVKFVLELSHLEAEMERTAEAAIRAAAEGTGST